MPTRNRIKAYGEDQYYHVYNRGVNKELIFREEVDYFYFLHLLKRHLSDERMKDKFGRPFRYLGDSIEVTAYCLMGNHFHMLVYLKEADGLVNLMRSAMTAYTMYYNLKYHRVGRLYQERFLASRITTEYYLWHVSRYIHLNPLDIGQDWQMYPYSSIKHFTGEHHADWVHENRLVQTTEERHDYLKFVSDYESYRRDLELLKNILAD